MADFFAIDVQPGANGKLAVIFDRTNKKPDEASGHVASPMVAVQTGGPSNGGGTVSSTRPLVRSSSTDPADDALSSWTAVAPATLPPAPATTNEPAADFLSVAVGPEIDFNDGSTISPGGFTVTARVANLSNAALNATLTRTASQSLLWVFRFTNGYQDAAAAARWNPVQGFTFGYNDYMTGPSPCAPPASGGDKCLLYPGDIPIQGAVDQSTGTIRFSVPRSVLRALSGGTGPGERPTEAPATTGSRFYDATMFSLGNTTSPLQAVQTFLYPFDNTPSMDFILPSAGGGGGAGDTGCKVHGGGSIAANSGVSNFNIDVHASTKGKVAYRGDGHDYNSTAIISLECTSPTTATIRSRGFDGNTAVSNVVVEVRDGGEKSSSDTFSISGLNSGYSRSGALTKGNIQVQK